MNRNSEAGRAGEPRARAALRPGQGGAPAPMRRDAPSPEEALRLVHELQVHQVELEMQNVELHRAQGELEASRAKYFELYDEAPAGYVTVSGQGLILEANLAVAAMLGVARSALARRPFSGFVHPDDRDAYRSQRAQLGGKRTRHSWDLRMARADGSPCWAHLQAALTPSGECRITLNDISERKLAEGRLAQADARVRQMQKEESLGRMAGAIAHHFNNKLQVVMGNLELAMDGRSRGLASAGLLREAMLAATQAAEMSTLMLAFVGQTDDHRARLDLSRACRGTTPLLRASLPAGVSLETEFPVPGPIVQAHEGQLQQVLLNLVGNAGEAVGAGAGAVRVSVAAVPPAEIAEARRFPVDWEPGGEIHACLEVADTGRGMADRDLDRIFDPFHSGRDAGRGLGLSVALGIVRAHGGAVSVHSEPGRGSTFRVLIPLSPPAPAAGA